MKPKTAGRAGGAKHPAFPIELARNAPHMPQRLDFNGVTTGARIMTLSGLKPIDTIRPGDRIVTRDAGAQPVLRIEHRSFVTRTVYVIAGSFGHHQRDQDTMLPGAQHVLVRDWRAQALTGCPVALLPAQTLVDGEFVRDLGAMPLSVIRIFCAEPQVFYADGMELATSDAGQTAMRAAT
ncbi:MAG: Hint domain-containing protein [Pseudomonadota bacterium]